ncbi:MAG TPA: [citrate (pro-3S)-lyase] ligase [Exilispira sp.]|nr:[citrate (pro-3S)-lyase] ligase [Exilispira sp.]
MLFIEKNIINLQSKDTFPDILQNFWNKNNLDIKPPLDKAMYITNDRNQIIAIAGYFRNIVKGIAIDPEYHGENLTGTLLTWALEEIKQNGYTTTLIYTKPENIGIFSDFGFSVIESTNNVVLLERGKPDFSDYLRTLEKIKVQNNINRASSIVVNCNPMTNGHLYLIEKASSESEHLIVFVLEEDLSYFPFKFRFKIVKEAVSSLKNVIVLPSSCYLISTATFPDYFLKGLPKEKVHSELDIAIFGKHIAPSLNIIRRFVGSEPYCTVTSAYNESMAALLPRYGIEFTIIERKEHKGKAISASQVRELIRIGKIDEIKEIVPPATFNFLISDEAKDIIKSIQTSNKRH